jgi:sugar phosphate isomerase/epimerase
MKLGVFVPVFSHFEGPLRSLDEMLDTVVDLGLDAVEFGLGPLNGVLHYSDLAVLSSDPNAVRALAAAVSERGLKISALACHGNPIHPRPTVANDAHGAFMRTLRLAEELNVEVVNLYSGCPGDGPEARYPNWVTSLYPPEMGELLDWQWNEVLIPYWHRAGRLAEEAGVKLGFELHPGMLVHNPATLLRLRHAVGPVIGANLDVGHMFDQQIDPIVAIRDLGPAIHYVSAKDMSVNTANISRHGVYSPQGAAWPLESDHTANKDLPYGNFGGASYTTRTLGYGHDTAWWRGFATALATVDYTGVISIEQGDPIASVKEGLAKSASLLREVMFTEPGFGSRPAASVWVDDRWQFSAGQGERSTGR